MLCKMGSGVFDSDDIFNLFDGDELDSIDFREVAAGMTVLLVATTKIVSLRLRCTI